MQLRPATADDFAAIVRLLDDVSLDASDLNPAHTAAFLLLCDADRLVACGAVERFAFFEFVSLNAHIELDHGGDPDAARCRLFMCEVRRDVGTLDWSVAYGVYHDRYERRPEGWRFSRRDYQSLTRTDGEVFPFPLHPGGPVTVDSP